MIKREYERIIYFYKKYNLKEYFIIWFIAWILAIIILSVTFIEKQGFIGSVWFIGGIIASTGLILIYMSMTMK